jgi:hypothetical protein
VECYDKRFVSARQQRALRIFDLEEVGRVSLATGLFCLFVESCEMSIVMKFGGTSVADAAALANVARIVAAEREAVPVVVVSAMSGVTDALLASVRLATEHGADQAIASLNDTFERHRIATEVLLSSETADEILA